MTTGESKVHFQTICATFFVIFKPPQLFSGKKIMIIVIVIIILIIIVIIIMTAMAENYLLFLLFA